MSDRYSILPLWLRIAWREVRNNRRFSFFFVLNLAMGLAGFIAIDAFKVSIQKEVTSGSRRILGGDLAVTCANRTCTDDEKDIIKSEGDSSHVLSLFSMLAAKDKTRLAQLVMVSDNFPQYGTLTFREPKQGLNAASLAEAPKCWLYPELALQLGVSLGDKVKIGDAVFVLAGVVDQDSTTTGSSFNFVARAYISDRYAEQTKLIRPGSRFTQNFYLKLPGLGDDELVGRVTNLQKKLGYNDIRVVSHMKASDNLARAMTYLSDYLGLLALIALFLAAAGSTYLYRSFLMNRAKDIAILLSLGASPTQAKLAYGMQLVILGLAAALGAMAVAALTFPLFPLAAKGILPLEVAPSLYPQVILVALLMGTFGSVLVGLPLLQTIGSIKPLALLNEQTMPLVWKKRSFLLYVPAILMYWGLAILEARSYKTGSLFMGGMLGAIIVFGVVGASLYVLLKRFDNWTLLNVRLALRYLARQKLSSLSCFLALGFAAMLINLVPQIYKIVEEEVATPKGFLLPSLFLIDIQDDQVTELHQFMHARAYGLDQLSPLVRARLSTINGVVPERREREETAFSREEENSEAARNRGQNLTYRAKLSPSERLTEGREFSGAFDSAGTKPAEVSVEMRYAQRLGVKLGDKLSFDIQGVEVTAEVVNIRKVRWTSFQPNFFVTFQPGVLEDAPKIYLASVPPLPEEKKFSLQADLVQKFPNISIVDVAGTVQRVLDVIYKMGSVIGVMAYFALFVGLIVLFSIANQQAMQRQRDINLLKILGYEFGPITSVIAIEFFILAFSASVIGVALATAVSFALAELIFESPWQASYGLAAVTVMGVSIMSMLVATSATRRVLAQKPTF